MDSRRMGTRRAHTRSRRGTPPMTEAPLPLRLRLLDGFRLDCDGAQLHVVPGVRRLLALPALRAAPVDRTSASALLWPDATARRAAACLRSTLWRLAKPAEGMVLHQA